MFPRVDGSLPAAGSRRRLLLVLAGPSALPKKSMAYLAEAAYNCIAEFEPGDGELEDGAGRILRHMVGRKRGGGSVDAFGGRDSGSFSQPRRLDAHHSRVLGSVSWCTRFPPSLASAFAVSQPGQPRNHARTAQGSVLCGVLSSFATAKDAPKHLAQVWKNEAGYWKTGGLSRRARGASERGARRRYS